MSEQKISNIPLKAAQFNRHRQAQIRFASKICSQICIFMFKVPQWKFSNVSFTHANKKKTRKQTHKEWTWVQAYDLSKDRRFQHFDYSYQPKTKTVACNRQESLTNPNHLDLKQNICSALHSRRNPPIRNNEDNFFSHKCCTFQSQPQTTHCFTSYWPKKKISRCNIWRESPIQITLTYGQGSQIYTVHSHKKWQRHNFLTNVESSNLNRKQQTQFSHKQLNSSKHRIKFNTIV